MELQEIYNIIIAAIPALTAICTVLGLTIKIVSGFVALKKSVNDSSVSVDNVVKELRVANKNLQDQLIETQKQLDQLTYEVTKVVDHIDTQGPTDVN